MFSKFVAVMWEKMNKHTNGQKLQSQKQTQTRGIKVPPPPKKKKNVQFIP